MDKRSKLDSKLEKCIFIKYKDGVKGYKLWNLVTSKEFDSIDKFFSEQRKRGCLQAQEVSLWSKTTAQDVVLEF